MPSSHQCAAFENRHRGGGDESSKVERQRITTHARMHARPRSRTQAGTGKQWIAWLHKQNKDFEMPKTPFQRPLLYHFITTIIIFYHMTTAPHTCTHTNTLTLSAESCIFYLPPIFLSLGLFFTLLSEAVMTNTSTARFNHGDSSREGETTPRLFNIEPRCTWKTGSI